MDHETPRESLFSEVEERRAVVLYYSYEVTYEDIAITISLGRDLLIKGSAPAIEADVEAVDVEEAGWKATRRKAIDSTAAGITAADVRKMLFRAFQKMDHSRGFPHSLSSFLRQESS
ncbi:MAG: hypothetical protein Q9188_006553, partial [Gyalolechia gomerana]